METVWKAFSAAALFLAVIGLLMMRVRGARARCFGFAAKCLLGMAWGAAGLTVAAPAVAHAQAIDTVRVGDPALSAIRMPLGADTVDSYKVSAGARQLTAVTVRTVSLDLCGREPLYVIRTLHGVPQGDTALTTMAVRASDMSLAHHHVQATRDSAAVTATHGHLTGWVVLPGQPARLLDQPLAGPVFGVDGQVPWLLPLLPFHPDYHAVVPHYSPWEGKEMWTPVEVLGEERVTVGARPFDCWQVDVGPLGPPGYRMVRWIDRVSHRVVQSALRGAAGETEYWSVLRP